jgi:nitrous oxide reductase accessory protein NosL
MKQTLVGLSAGLLLAACVARAEGPPEIALDRTACSHCGMLISDAIYAAAYRPPGAAARVFDDIGCLLAAARREVSPPDRFWFQDAAGGGWTEGTTAVFVSAAALRTPMGGGIVAYRNREAAERAARSYRGQIVESLPALLARNSGER